MPIDPAHNLIADIIKSLAEPLAQQPSLPAVDVADLRVGLTDGTPVAFGQAEAEGKDRAIRAAEGAIAALRLMRKAEMVE